MIDELPRMAPELELVRDYNKTGDARLEIEHHLLAISDYFGFG
jgi:hypothetical protein